ncbi:MAG: ABC transporter ATP-binding protein, partial [Pseudomonadales bacterium]|nr:ABC transporter ATP-binding protein [Pseudomonadales bacterium]
KQRLALARTLVHKPEMLFLDEPTSGVDPLSRRRFWDLIDTLTRSGTTVFVSTHYMEEAENCDRLALMNRGKLIALDTPAELRAGMRDPLLELRTSDAPRAVEALREVPGVLETALFGRSIHVAVSDEAGVQDTMVARLAERGIELYAIDNVVPSLEDAFVAQVRAAGGAPVE